MMVSSVYVTRSDAMVRPPVDGGEVEVVGTGGRRIGGGDMDADGNGGSIWDVS